MCQQCLHGAYRPLPWVGEWGVLAELGRGASGQVFLAVAKDGERLAALKVSLGDPSCDSALAQEGRERFRREVQLLRALDHPGVVRVYGGGVTPEGRWVALELLDEDLCGRLQRAGPLPLAQATGLGADLLGTLAHIHLQGMLHRDLKPHNVLLDLVDSPRLGDFGLGRLAGATRLTESKLGLGTLHYGAPEQLEDAHEVDVRADVYGWGATLYHALTGRPPFWWARGYPALARALRSDELPTVQLLRRDVPPALSSTVMRALARDPARRFASAAEVLEEWSGG